MRALAAAIVLVPVLILEFFVYKAIIKRIYRKWNSK